MKQKISGVLFVLLGLFLVGCSTQRGLRNLKGLDSGTSGYRYGNSFWLLQFADLAYLDEIGFRKGIRELGIAEGTTTRLIEHKGSDAQAYVVSDRDVIIVAFRGTEGTKDILAGF